VTSLQKLKISSPIFVNGLHANFPLELLCPLGKMLFLGKTKFAKHEKYVQAKLSASYPAETNNDAIDEANFTQQDRIDFADHIENNLPKHMFGIFNSLKENRYNLKSLKLKERRLIISELRNILGG